MTRCGEQINITQGIFGRTQSIVLLCHLEEGHLDCHQVDPTGWTGDVFTGKEEIFTARMKWGESWRWENERNKTGRAKFRATDGTEWAYPDHHIHPPAKTTSTS